MAVYELQLDRGWAARRSRTQARTAQADPASRYAEITEATKRHGGRA